LNLAKHEPEHEKEPKGYKGNPDHFVQKGQHAFVHKVFNFLGREDFQNIETKESK
jgi:hypothetical protein